MSLLGYVLVSHSLYHVRHFGTIWKAQCKLSLLFFQYWPKKTGCRNLVIMWKGKCRCSVKFWWNMMMMIMMMASWVTCQTVPAVWAGQNADRPTGKGEATSGSTAWLCQWQRWLQGPPGPVVHPGALGSDLHPAAPAALGPLSTDGSGGSAGERAISWSVKLIHIALWTGHLNKHNRERYKKRETRFALSCYTE